MNRREPDCLAGFMAEKLGAKVYHLPVPAVVSSVGLKQILLEDENIRSCLEMAKSASRAMIGVGKVSNDATVVSAGFLDRTMINELKTKGAVGDRPKTVAVDAAKPAARGDRRSC
ncbi:MAG: sugar-binding domain-containing protein [Chthoniobacterales bacterium]